MFRPWLIFRGCIFTRMFWLVYKELRGLCCGELQEKLEGLNMEGLTLGNRRMNPFNLEVQ